MGGWDQNQGRDRERQPDGSVEEEEERSGEQQHQARRQQALTRKRAGIRRGEAVQAKGAVSAEAAHEHAADGLSEAHAPLPHREQIQASFGAHDVSGVKAAVGGRAQSANEAMGSTAFTRGDQVAFRGAPDLHTAAHEAAHAVQQRQGVSVAGGVGKPGDGYEKHADAVADRVVAGKSAAPILEQMTGRGRSAAVQHKSAPIQFLGGNIETAHVGAGISPQAHGAGGAAPTVAQELAVRDKAGGRPGQDKPVERDANHNNKRKVEFEAALSNALLQSPQTYSGAIFNVSHKILNYIDTKVAAQVDEAGRMAAADSELNALKGDDPYFGRVVAAAGKTFAQTIRQVLAGGGTVPNHLMAHSMFLVNIYSNDFKTGVAQKLVKVAKSPKYLKEKGGKDAPAATQVKLGGGQSVTPFASEKERGRIAPGKPGSPYQGSSEENASAQVPRTNQASGLTPRPAEHGPGGGAPGKPKDDQPTPISGGAHPAPGADQSHERGADRWTADEENAFVQDARIVLDMPLSGAGASGSTSELLNCAIILGTPVGPPLMDYALGVMAYLGGAGAHSFHEIMSIAAAAGLPYVPGQYKSMFTPAFMASPAYQALHKQFADVIDAPPITAAPPAVADAHAGGGAAAPPPKKT
ncbi:MAG TPA: DUF4157 domain-containing protein [Polyangia bacterium]|nr:DUF4157 domain-containing protein [Polyangia bacterium]